jgi:hypothetical protein
MKSAGLLPDVLISHDADGMMWLTRQNIQAIQISSTYSFFNEEKQFHIAGD